MKCLVSRLNVIQSGALSLCNHRVFSGVQLIVSWFVWLITGHSVVSICIKRLMECSLALSVSVYCFDLTKNLSLAVDGHLSVMCMLKALWPSGKMPQMVSLGFRNWKFCFSVVFFGGGGSLLLILKWQLKMMSHHGHLRDRLFMCYISEV